ncbi:MULTISPECIES: outer membrane lipoprotein-sorting protein [Myxococcus]|nr:MULTISPECIES: outer membrane lipoprotein-sorting protein [Myxococcus]NOJ52382.1 outer membrane lipoprotein-sorting protein [Myxococcus xanthus]QPM78747.1 outer membrane lipoprotein-sorting protein [Myxococcus xanthus]QVW67818.1 outer membrane lipoprotein-sorting protein [Myxococcus xanthus DZ2]UEO06061.1 outer membrane lipoprotein-sorting protein [Myxococcus xanthus DZ2]UYI13679.1 outer membrane lipoprotein-sorting protein [Myxococcus xanthus]
MKHILALILGLLLLHTGTARAAEPDAAEILKASDRSRGGGLPGIRWTVRITPESGVDKEPERLLTLKANATASLAETREPVRFKGSKLLQVDRNMWMSRPGLRKPIPISPRQKLSGQASQGDIASTNYAVDYQGKLLREEDVNGEASYVLELKAINTFCTYDRITYWVSKERQVGVKAEFFSLSGKLLKSATFEYGNQLTHEGKTFPFVSKMTIQDALTPARTTLEYADVQVTELARGTFDVNRLGN